MQLLHLLVHGTVVGPHVHDAMVQLEQLLVHGTVDGTVCIKNKEHPLIGNAH